jgi:hypothetical protein
MKPIPLEKKEIKSMVRFALMIASMAELATGAIALVGPAVIVRLLFGVEMSGIAIVMSRIAGGSLIALSMAFWPGDFFTNQSLKEVLAMGIYSLISSFYLGYLAFAGEFVGILLWQAVIVHAILTVLLCIGIFKEFKIGRGN